MLIRYYNSDDNDVQNRVFDRMFALIPNESNRIQELQKPITKEDTSRLSTRRIKTEIRKSPKNLNDF